MSCVSCKPRQHVPHDEADIQSTSLQDVRDPQAWCQILEKGVLGVEAAMYESAAQSFRDIIDDETLASVTMSNLSRVCTGLKGSAESHEECGVSAEVVERFPHPTYSIHF